MPGGARSFGPTTKYGIRYDCMNISTAHHISHGLICVVSHDVLRYTVHGTSQVMRASNVRCTIVCY